MSCLGTTTNNRPVGAGYNAQGNAISLVELSGISVSSVQTNTILPATGSTVTVVGSLSAATYLGVPGGTGSPSGNNNTIQFNNGGTFSGIPNAIYNPTTNSVILASAAINNVVLSGITGIGLGSLSDVTLAATGMGNVLVNNGSNWVNIASGNLPYAGATALSGLTSDVAIVTPAVGQALCWSAAGSRWVASSVINSLSSNSDVGIVTPATGQVLAWNNATAKWVASSIPPSSIGGTNTQIQINNNGILSGTNSLAFSGNMFLANTVSAGSFSGLTLSGSLRDVLAVPAANNGQALCWNHTTQRWNASTLPSVAGATALSSLTTDVAITTPLGGQALVWSATGNRWVVSSIGPYQPLDATLTTMAGVTTTTNSLIFFSGVDTAGRINFTTLGRAFASSVASLAAQDLFYADSPNSVTTFNGPGNAAAVFVSKSDGSFRWLLPSNPGDILTYNGSDLEWSPP